MVPSIGSVRRWTREALFERNGEGVRVYWPLLLLASDCVRCWCWSMLSTFLPLDCLLLNCDKPFWSLIIRMIGLSSVVRVIVDIVSSLGVVWSDVVLRRVDEVCGDDSRSCCESLLEELN